MRLPALLLLVAAVVLVWPAPSGLRRLGPRPRVVRRRPSPEALLLSAPHRLTLGACLAAAILMYVCGGPVAAFAAGAYVALGSSLAVQHLARSRASRRVAAELDLLSAFAADLRAGASLGSDLSAGAALGSEPRAVPGVTAGAGPGRVRPREAAPSALAGTLAAVRQLSEQTGAPVSDLLDRIEAEGRAVERARSSALAEAAGTRMTAWLLMALPGGGMALGYSVGVDPVHVLLGTPVGALCAVLAVALHVAGVLWSDRLAHGATPSGGGPRIGDSKTAVVAG